KWEHLIARKVWDDCYEEAREEVDLSVKVKIQGSDIDPEMIKIARQNARLAGVEQLIDFEVGDAGSLPQEGRYGFIITNPPYGERLEEKASIPPLYRKIGESFKRLDTWSLYLITSYEGAQKDIGRKADKNRKIYNGMMKTYYYQFMGPRPPKKTNNV
ncbi:MAG: methyltransferase, partial [Lachnospiraceae bacterium]|nr:methyltransferase [Lachnospiraceae bacterium]